MKKRTISYIALFLSLVTVFMTYPFIAIAAEYDDSYFDPTNVIADKGSDNVYIVSEDESQRSENSKVFLMSDGSYSVAVYPFAVHYEEDGEMKEIDNTLVSTEGGYATSAGDVTVSLPEAMGEGAVSYTNGEHSVTFSIETKNASKGQKKVKEKNSDKINKLSEGLAVAFMSDEEFEAAYGKKKIESEYAGADISEIIERHDQLMMTSDKLGSQITYTSVFSGTDLRYTVRGSVLKEEIIINSADAVQSKYEFTITSDTLTPRLGEEGEILLVDSEGNEIFNINTPYMYDAKGEVCYGIDVKLKENSDGSYTYRLSPDHNWLKNKSRVYPVVIDPPVSESTFSSVKDTTGVFSTSAGNIDNTYEYNHIKIGNKNLGSGVVEVQGMIYSALPGVLSAGTTKIINAKLMLFGEEYNYSDDLQINAYRITSDWNVSNVYENSVVLLGSDGRSDYTDVVDYAVAKSEDFEDSTPIYTWDITEAAQEWLEGRSTNYGIALRAEGLTAGTEKYVRFYDSTIDAQGTTGVCPQFVYTYRDLRGVEDYWSFTTVSAGRFGTLGINNYNGNPVITQSLVSSTGNNMPVSVSLIYSYNSCDNGGSGLGLWRTNYHMTVEPYEAEFKIGETVLATYKYMLVDSDGTRHYLREEGSKHKDEDGLGLTLTVLTGETDYKYQIETKGKTVYKFDHKGRLNRITDSNGNFNYIYYTDSENRVIDYIVEGNTVSTERPRTEFTYTDGNLIVTSPEGDYVTVDFISETNRTLQGIYYKDYGEGDEAGSGVTSFTYDSANNYFPKTITDGFGHVTTISCAFTVGSRRVTSVSWGTADEALQTFNFDYRHNATKITDMDGRAATYQFNNYGQTVGVVDHNTSWGQNYEYGVPDGTNKGYENKLVLASKTIAPAENRAAYHGFSTAASVNAYSVYPVSSPVTKTHNTTWGNTSTGSMQIVKTADNTADTFVYQKVTGLTTGNYTFSMYVKTGTGGLSGTGVRAQISVYNAGGYRTSNASNVLTATETGEWVRLQTTVNIVSGDTSVDVGVLLPADTYGTVFVDDVQLEFNCTGGLLTDNLSGAGSYNLLTDTTFMGTSENKWHGLGYTASSRPADAPTVVRRTESFSGSADENNYIYQTVDIAGTEGDIFIAGGWAKVNSVPLDNDENKKNNNLTPRAEIKIVFYNDLIPVGVTTVECNTAVRDWQYLMTKVVAPANYTKVTYSFEFGNNEGEAIFGAPFMYKESYGQSYAYDANGNLVSSTDAAETMAKFAYQDDALTSSLSPTGSRYIYTNDPDTGNILRAYSNAGQKIDITYNGTGDATSMLITDAPTYYDGEHIDNHFYIINAKTGRAITAYNASEGSMVSAANFNRWQSQQWDLSYLSSDIYTVRMVQDGDFALKTVTTATSTYHTVSESDVDTVPVAAYKFKFVKNSDGTFRILTGASGYTNAITMSEATYEKGYYKLTAGERYDDDKLESKWFLVSTNQTLKLESSAEYSSDGRYLISATDQRGNTTYYQYNSKGQVVKVTDAKGNETEYVYDSIGRTTNISKALSQVTYTYSADSVKRISVDGGAVVYDFATDKFGRSTAVSVGNGTDSLTLASYTYTDDLLTKQTYGNGAFIELSYDSVDRLTRKVYNGNTSKYVQYFYNGDGNMYRIKDTVASSNTLYEYDLAGRVVGIGSSDLAGNTKGYIGTRYNDGTGLVGKQFITIYGEDNSRDFGVNYNYTYYGVTGVQSPDALLRLSFNGEMYKYEYDRLGRLVTRKSSIASTDGVSVSQRVNNGKKEIYTYVTADPVGGIAETTTLVHSYTDILGVCHYYDYDELGNITKNVIEYSKDEKYTIDYHYDAHSRLTRCDNEYLGYTVAYSYDNRGNITSCGEYEYTTGALTEDILYYSYDYTYDNTVWKDLLTEYDGESITYDDIGNPLSWMGTALTWQNGRQLATYGSGSKLVTYGYDGDGLRISKSGARNTEYIIVGGTYVGERTTINGTEYLIAYLYGDNGIIGINVNGTNYYFVKNLQGDITGIIDAEGNVVARYTYDVYGAPIDITDGDGNAVSPNNHTHIANLNPFRYRGYTYDQETGFYYLTTRYYDPYVGRFLNADGLVSTGVGMDGYNMFAYCNNNPVNSVDSMGNKPGDLFDTMDEAAIDFAKIYAPLGYENRIEYGSFIYSVDTYELRTYRIPKLKYFINFSLTKGFFLDLKIDGYFTITGSAKVTKYSYVTPNEGIEDEVNIPINWFNLKNKVAEIHNHTWIEGHYNQMFSPSDKRNYISYLVSPIGTLIKYDPAKKDDPDSGETTVCWDLPVDPKIWIGE